MKWMLVKNDLKRNKVINFALFLFMFFSAVLAVSSIIMATQTFTSISNLYQTAQPPHFLQMHKGEINQEEIDEFMSDYDDLTYWQTNTTIAVYGESLTVVSDNRTYNLSNSQLDIALVKQNETRDLLLNSSHEKIALEEGEIGIPVLLKETYGMEIGDHVRLTSNGVSKEFVIKEFILDSMMNSTMASSTRILLSDEEFNMLEGQVGENEYLIEAYFTETSEASNFQTAYENAELPQDGQTITYTIIFLLSALTDIMTVFVLLLVSVLLIIVSFICVKYTMITTLEEEISEIGTMKAIGLPFSEIRDLYLYKYRALAAASVMGGYLLALLISSLLTKHITATFGNNRTDPLAIVLSLIGAFLVYLLIIYYCKKLLNKMKKVTVVDALVQRKGFEKDQRIKNGLYQSKKLPVNWLIGLREVFFQFKNWIIVFTVVLIAVVMILIPVNLMNTLEAPEFITYMGSSEEDILIEIENGEKLAISYENVKKVLENDGTVQHYNEFRRVRVQTTDTEKERINLTVDNGVNSGAELQYLSGKAPGAGNEIALSYLNAEKVGKGAGEQILLYVNDNPQQFIISGIYQDVTSGGYTAKAQYNFSELTAEKYTFSVNLHDQVDERDKANEWSRILGGAVTVHPMEEFINQTLGGVVKQLRMIVLASSIIGICLTILITVMFLKLRLAKDFSEIAALNAIGFSEVDIRQQYLIKTGAVAMTGILAGIVITDVLGERIVSSLLSLSGLGINKVAFISNPFIEYIICPGLLLVLILLVTWMVMKTIQNYNLISNINK
ncbi:putative ABC transport system permease protein [Gracilibacillus ureilyticus]|uniref:Putative ABC transport system permease protein n=1 Tax=Gracilibacillus ureilyticus TaxID=531814 RepID=A0A1H9MJE6_9BACI|nr:FtsX-like permease family protein [Gracilibacillus ureilyticus]SER23748.1 putative ABC transport system permease protein [Gracilibacillus ureilyticus]